MAKQAGVKIFSQKTIIPVKLLSGSRLIVPLAKEGKVVYISQYQEIDSLSDVLSWLNKYGIKFANAHEFPYLQHSQLKKFLHQLEPNDVLDAMQLKNDFPNVTFTSMKH